LTEKSPARVRARPPIGATFRKVKELAYTQIGITCDGAAAINDGVDAIARNTNRMRKLVLVMPIAFRNSSLRISTGWGLEAAPCLHRSFLLRLRVIIDDCDIIGVGL
jgi:hypothetical protein